MDGAPAAAAPPVLPPLPPLPAPRALPALPPLPALAAPPAAQHEPAAVPAARDESRPARQERALALLERKTDNDGRWTHLDWEPIVTSALVRVLNPSRIDQVDIGVCGVAASLHALAHDDPEKYAALVIEIFEEGTAGGRDINSTLRENPPLADMDACDWMTLSALQSVTNKVLEFHGTKEEFGLRAGTIAHDSWMLKNISGCVKTAQYSCWTWGVQRTTKRVSDLLRKHGSDVVVLMQVRSDPRVMNRDGRVHREDIGRQYRPDHIVGLVGPVRWSPDLVEAPIFTWGASRVFKMTPRNFEHITFTYTVGARKANIEL